MWLEREQGALQAREGMYELLEGCQGCSPVSPTINNPSLSAVNNPGSQAGIVGAALVKVAPHWFLFNPKGDSLPVGSCLFCSALLFSSNNAFKYTFHLGKIS